MKNAHVHSRIYVAPELQIRVSTRHRGHGKVQILALSSVRVQNKLQMEEAEYPFYQDLSTCGGSRQSIYTSELDIHSGEDEASTKHNLEKNGSSSSAKRQTIVGKVG